ncbi:18191_t:CDS:10 [Rhizophagus irregularis]|nr:18191_t:CDS:10 [Rhizophagus irregularis]
MTRNWYDLIVQKNPSKCQSYQRINRSRFVVDFSFNFEVLPLHKELSEFSIPKNFYNELEKTQQKNMSVGYMHLHNNILDESSWVPLLPGYVIYTSLGGLYFKLSIERNEDSLQFFWQEFGKDFTFTSCKAQGRETLGFYLMIKQYNIKNISVVSALGFNEPTIVTMLQNTVHKIFSHRFCQNSNFQSPLTTILKEETLVRNLKRKSVELEQLCEKDSVIHGIKLEEDGKNLSPKFTQALMVMHEKYKSTCYNANRSIKRLKTKIDQLNRENFDLDSEIDLNEKSERIKKAVNKILDEKKLGSTILVSTEQYLSLVLSHPCSHCCNTDFQKKSYHVSCAGFNVAIDLDCQLCGTIDSYSNQSKGTNFSHLVAASTLAGGMNHYAMQAALAVMGITAQSCKSSYHQYQSRMFPALILKAEESTKQALKAAITHTLTEGKKALTIGFDCSWSHSRNAKQASGEFIYLEELEVEKSRITTKKGKDGTSEEKVVIHQGNFDASSRQMEHAILIALLEQIIPILEESDLLLEVCIDGDLDSNKTLANVPIVYFNGCVFTAGLRKKNNDPNAPTNEELRYIQVEGLIQHLLNNHDLCWKEQSLVTHYRTAYNEAFNRKILRFTDKRIDFWASYKARHALAVIDNNEGLDCMMEGVREAAKVNKFSVNDQYNISKLTRERQSQMNCNRNAIDKRNQELAKNYANDRQELQGFDFSQELIPYKYKAEKRIRSNSFYPSFAKLIPDFDVIIKCQGCSAFRKKTVSGLCSLCSFYISAGWWDCLLNKNYTPSSEKNILDLKELIKLATKKIFGFDHLREGQLEAIEAYLNGKDTLVSIKTGGGKTLCYVICALIFEGITIVISPLKALIEDQKRELIQLGIPCASIYANTIQGRSEQEKIFEEIALGFTKILFITPKKLCLNREFQNFISNMYDKAKVRFVIDEAHCILNYSNFRESWKNLGILKKNWSTVPIMLLTATCTYKDAQDIRTSLEIQSTNFAMIRGSSFERKEITIEVYKRRDNRENFSNDLINLIKNHENGRIIIYCATQSGCDDLFATLQPLLPDKSLGVYHGGIGDEQRQIIISHWKDGKIQIMIGTNAFGMGVNSSDVYLVIHCVAPLNMTNLIQEIGRAGRNGNEAKSVIFYSIKKDFRTNFGILSENRETCFNVQNMTDQERERKHYLDISVHKIHEVLLFCRNQYECRSQIINRYYLWNGDNVSSPCLKCDNCRNRIKEQPTYENCVEDILHLLDTVEEINDGGNYEIIEDDIVELKVYKSGRKPKFGKPKELTSYMLADLVVRGYIEQKISLYYSSPNAQTLSMSMFIIGLKEGAKERAIVDSWYYWTRKK